MPRLASQVIKALSYRVVGKRAYVSVHQIYETIHARRRLRLPDTVRKMFSQKVGHL